MSTLNTAKRASLLALGLALVLFAISAPADSRTATVKFDTWVEIPGQVLPGGTYIFVLSDNQGAEHHVQIFDMVTRRLVAVVATDPDQLQQPQEENVRLEQRQGPFRGEAVAEWFRPGARVGERFVYQPGSMIGEATMLATAEDLDHPVQTTADLSQASPLAETPQLSGQAPEQFSDQVAKNNAPAPVESQPQTLQENPAQMPDQTQPAQAAQPAPTLNAQATTPQIPSGATEETPVGTPESLPKTATRVPLIAAFGLLTLAAAGALRVFLRA
jgi:hypothetical protein